MNIQHFIVQITDITLKNVPLVNHYKIKEAGPTCFGLQENHHQESTGIT